MFKAITFFLPVQFIIKKSFIILFIIVLISILNNSNSYAKNIDDYGVISLMYHRFEENKYPSTNIKIKDFKRHLDLIKENDFNFISHKEFVDAINLKILTGKFYLPLTMVLNLSTKMLGQF